MKLKNKHIKMFLVIGGYSLTLYVIFGVYLEKVIKDFYDIAFIFSLLFFAFPLTLLKLIKEIEAGFSISDLFLDKLKDFLKWL